MSNKTMSAPEQTRALYEHEAMELLGQYEIPTPPHSFAQSAQEAMQAAREIGFPVVLKVVSAQVLHKSDAGGVRLGLESAERVEAAWTDIQASVLRHSPGAKIEGMLVVKQLPPGLECVVGMVRDAQFGPALMFGLGGVLVELMQDVAFGLLPLDMAEARALIGEVKGSRLLHGYRGKPPLDVNAVADVLVKVGHLAEVHPEIQELEINPLMVYEQGIMPVDVRALR